MNEPENSRETPLWTDLAEPDPTWKEDLDLIEQQGLEHISSPDCWCHPELDYKDPETGAEVWVHKELQ